MLCQRACVTDGTQQTKKATETRWPVGLANEHLIFFNFFCCCERPMKILLYINKEIMPFLQTNSGSVWSVSCSFPETFCSRVIQPSKFSLVMLSPKILPTVFRFRSAQHCRSSRKQGKKCSRYVFRGLKKTQKRTKTVCLVSYAAVTSSVTFQQYTV